LPIHYERKVTLEIIKELVPSQRFQNHLETVQKLARYPNKFRALPDFTRPNNIAHKFKDRKAKKIVQIIPGDCSLFSCGIEQVAMRKWLQCNHMLIRRFIEKVHVWKLTAL
jgi:hypothetical protein